MSNIEDFKTPAQKAREAKHKKICDDFLVITKENPGLKKYKYFTWLGAKHKMTPEGIRLILKRHGYNI